MSQIGSVFLRLGIKSDANKKLNGIFKGMQGQMLKFGAMFGAFNFFKKGIKAASDFQENWSVVANAVPKEIQDKFLEGFKNLKRTSKAEFADLSATIVGTLKSKGVDEKLIGKLGPEVIKRLEDTGAFYNKTSEEVLHSFTSMISGMARPMEMLTKGAVVPLTKNLDVLAQQQFGVKFENLAPDQQTLLRLQFFLDGTAKVPYLVNNSAKTINTFKGRMDSFKKTMSDSSAVIAKSFMPALGKIIGILAKLATFVGDNIKLFTVLIGIWAGFKIATTFIKAIKGMIALFTALAAAKAAAQGGMFGVIAAGAVVAGLGAIIGGVLAGVGIGGIGSSSSSSSVTNPKLPDNKMINVKVVMNPISGKAQATSNGRNISMQDNFGRGGN